MKHKPITKARRMRLISLHGDRCINCGSPDEIEWHHVVPLEIGGNDVDTNMVPLCYSCHKAVTHHELLLKTSGRRHKTGGRKKKIPENYRKILYDYLYGEFGKTECLKRLGLSHGNRLTDNDWFKEFIKELGIKEYRNKIDLYEARGFDLPYGKVIGYVKYNNGMFDRIRYRRLDHMTK